MQLISIQPTSMFQALTDSTRIRIVRLLAESKDEACLCEIADSLEEPEYKLSRHLKVLRQSGLLSASKEGRWIYHKLVRGVPPLEAVFKSVLTLPDDGKVFASDLRRFKRRIPLRQGGRCRSERTISKVKSKKSLN